MGEAKRRACARKEHEANGSAAPTDVTVPASAGAMAAAVRQVVTAVTATHGADCGMYALVGAALLRALGVPAHPAAGSAAWRVGPGNGDVLSHAAELAGPYFVPARQPGPSGPVPVGLFHAWIEVDGPGGGAIVDFTTWQLPRKAAALDAADGGHTEVRWAPPFLWVPRRAGVPLRAVAAAAEGGAFSYVRHAEYEPVVFTPDARDAAGALAAAARVALEAHAAGHSLAVVGVDPRDPTAPPQTGLAWDVTAVAADDPAALVLRPLWAPLSGPSGTIG